MFTVSVKNEAVHSRVFIPGTLLDLLVLDAVFKADSFVFSFLHGHQEPVPPAERWVCFCLQAGRLLLLLPAWWSWLRGHLTQC